MKSHLLKVALLFLAVVSLFACTEKNPVACDSETVKVELMDIVQKHDRLRKIMVNKILKGEAEASCKDQKDCQSALYTKYEKASVKYTPIMIFSILQMVPKENTLTCRVMIKGEIESVDNTEEIALRYEVEKSTPPKVRFIRDE